MLRETFNYFILTAAMFAFGCSDSKVPEAPMNATAAKNQEQQDSEKNEDIDNLTEPTELPTKPDSGIKPIDREISKQILEARKSMAVGGFDTLSSPANSPMQGNFVSMTPQFMQFEDYLLLSDYYMRIYWPDDRFIQ